ncbi:MAG TPA: bestrophin family ion channel [Burkholderiales bacterium]|nr:bestrophin family ion channel [Burkholderiales bacterium]
MRLGQTHNLRTWLLHLVFFYREKVFRKLIPIMTVLAVYAIVIVYIDAYSNRFEKLEMMNLGQFHLIFSFILGIIISFRVNTTYARWWEGRVLWGNIVNNCRNLGMKFDNFAGLQNYPHFFDCLRILPAVIKFHLRKDRKSVTQELNSIGIIYEVEHPVIYLTNRMYGVINELRNQDKIRFEQYMAMDMHLVNLIDMTGGCERIANTPVPAAFAFFVKQALLFYSLIFPFGWVDKFGYFIIPMILMMVYVLLGLEILSEELENPFGTDDNDLPLDSLTTTIANNVTSIAERKV